MTFGKEKKDTLADRYPMPASVNPAELMTFSPDWDDKNMAKMREAEERRRHIELTREVNLNRRTLCGQCSHLNQAHLGPKGKCNATINVYEKNSSFQWSGSIGMRLSSNTGGEPRVLYTYPCPCLSLFNAPPLPEE